MNFSLSALIGFGIFLRTLIVWLSHTLYSPAHQVFIGIDLLLIFLVYLFGKRSNSEKTKSIISYLLFNPFTLYILSLNNLSTLLFERKAEATLDAYNFWGIIYGNQAINDTLRISGFSIQFLGNLFFLAFLLVILLWAFEKRTNQRILFTISFIVLAFFLFATRRTQLDIYLLFPFLALLIHYSTKFIKVFWTISIASFFNYFINMRLIDSIYISFFDNWFISRILSLFVFFVFVWMYFYGREIIVSQEMSLKHQTRTTKKQARIIKKPTSKKQRKISLFQKLSERTLLKARTYQAAVSKEYRRENFENTTTYARKKKS